MCSSCHVWSLSGGLEGRCNVGQVVLMAAGVVVDMQAVFCPVSVLQLYISASKATCVSWFRLCAHDFDFKASVSGHNTLET